MYAWALRPLLFLPPPGVAHELAFAALTPIERFAWLRALLSRAAGSSPRDERVGVRVMGLSFPSILGLAAGFDKNARCPRALSALGFGHLEFGTVTAAPQSANPRPNLFRLPADRALVNRLGFPNDGAERVAERLRQVRRDDLPPIGISIGKSRPVPVEKVDAVVRDYLASFDAVRGVADFVVINVSSPNTTGLRTMQAHEHAHALLAALRARAGTTRLLVKIAPDLDEAQLEDILSVVEEVAIDGVVATNTTTARRGLKTDPERIAAIGAGGLSGAPLRERALEVVRRVRARLGRGVAVIGVGGVEQASDVLALVRAGADLVQMYTGFVYGGPSAPSRIARELGGLVAGEGAATIADLIGGGKGGPAHPRAVLR